VSLFAADVALIAARVLQRKGRWTGEKKARIVVVGSSEHAVAFVRSLSSTALAAYDVTLVAAEDYWVDAARLPDYALGLLSERAVVEPMRAVAGAVCGSFVRATPVDIAPSVQVPRRGGWLVGDGWGARARTHCMARDDAVRTSRRVSSSVGSWRTAPSCGFRTTI
jgi:hypothetical protein